MGVAAEIGQHGLGTAERGLGVDDPFGFAQRREPGGEGVSLSQARPDHRRRPDRLIDAAPSDLPERDVGTAGTGPARTGRTRGGRRSNACHPATIHPRARSCGHGGDGSAPIPMCAARWSCRCVRRGAWDRPRSCSASRPMPETAGHRRPSCSSKQSGNLGRQGENHVEIIHGQQIRGAGGHPIPRGRSLALTWANTGQPDCVRLTASWIISSGCYGSEVEPVSNTSISGSVETHIRSPPRGGCTLIPHTAARLRRT